MSAVGWYMCLKSLKRGCEGCHSGDVVAGSDSGRSFNSHWIEFLMPPKTRMGQRLNNIPSRLCVSLTSNV
jgi:hypothetical protein